MIYFINNKRSIFIGILVLISSIQYSCNYNINQWTVPQELIGTWKSDKIKVTVRSEPKWMKFKFTPDSASISITINKDKTATGSVGLAEFKNGKIRLNLENCENLCISYIIECGSIGKIFNNDPLENKEVEIWLGPLNTTIDSELRFTEGIAHFPMAGMLFTKVE